MVPQYIKLKYREGLLALIMIIVSVAEFIKRRQFGLLFLTLGPAFFLFSKGAIGLDTLLLVVGGVAALIGTASSVTAVRSAGSVQRLFQGMLSRGFIGYVELFACGLFVLVFIAGALAMGELISPREAAMVALVFVPLSVVWIGLNLIESYGEVPSIRTRLDE